MKAKSKFQATIAVVGAGIAGLAAARELQGAGAHVTVFDKGRRVGGRMSTRQSRDDLAFDHGAQYFTVKDGRFRAQVTAWQNAGVVAEWKGKVGTLSGRRFIESTNKTQRFVGVPGMNAICTSLAEGVDVRCQTIVADLGPTECGWRLADDGAAPLGEFDFVVVSAPAPQTASLIGESILIAQVAKQTPMAGCWAMLLAFEDSLGPEFDGAFVDGSPIAWIVRDGSKPARSPLPET